MHNWGNLVRLLIIARPITMKAKSRKHFTRKYIHTLLLQNKICFIIIHIYLYIYIHVHLYKSHSEFNCQLVSDQEVKYTGHQVTNVKQTSRIKPPPPPHTHTQLCVFKMFQHRVRSFEFIIIPKKVDQQ